MLDIRSSSIIKMDDNIRDFSAQKFCTKDLHLQYSAIFFHIKNIGAGDFRQGWAGKGIYKLI